MIDFGLKMMDFIAVCGRGAVRRYHQRPVRPGSSALARVWEIYDERHVEGLSVHGCNAVYSRPGYTNGKRWRGVCKWCACPAAGGGRAPRERRRAIKPNVFANATGERRQKRFHSALLLEICY